MPVVLRWSNHPTCVRFSLRSIIEYLSTFVVLLINRSQLTGTSDLENIAFFSKSTRFPTSFSIYFIAVCKTDGYCTVINGSLRYYPSSIQNLPHATTTTHSLLSKLLVCIQVTYILLHVKFWIVLKSKNGSQKSFFTAWEAEFRRFKILIKFIQN